MFFTRKSIEPAIVAHFQRSVGAETYYYGKYAGNALNGFVVKHTEGH